MKNHLVSHISAAVVTGALAAMIASGILLWKIDLLPDWGWLETSAGAICVAAFAVIGVATIILGVCMAAHAERAFRAGARYRRTAYLALAICAGCVFVDVLAGHVGVQILDGGAVAMPAAWVTTAACIFIALARPLVAMVLQGVKGIEADEQTAREALEHAQTLERIEAHTRETSARIAGGAVSLDAERRSRNRLAAGAGAAIAALGLSAGAVSDARPVLPVEESPTMRLAADLMVRGPQSRHVEKYRVMADHLSANPNLPNARLARIVGVSRAQIRQWRKHWNAQQVLAHAPNRALLDVA